MKSPVPRRPTQRDIARALDLSQAAVSQALNGRGKLSASVRRRVADYAEKHGYRIDPALAALAAYRTGKREPGYLGTVAWLTNFSRAEGWKIGTFVEYHRGAAAFLREHGYELETFWMGEAGMTPRRMEDILKARGIECILVCPQEQPGTVTDWDFSEFSVVTFGFTLERPRFHMVTAQGFISMRVLFESLHRRGRRAIGFAYGEQIERRAQGAWLGGFLVAQLLQNGGRKIPPLRCDNLPERFERWLNRHRPDAVITTDSSVPDQLKAAGFRIPRDISLCFTVADPSRHIGGMVFDNLRIGEIAARKLISLHHARECGVPSVPEMTAIEGTFHPGKTVG
ncbi:MAG: LacI family transcriptional regulator [Chthoniobacterales bacterium]|nr:LacI family transcriptional regulator [Chthoniobacterales bacterium]